MPFSIPQPVVFSFFVMERPTKQMADYWHALFLDFIRMMTPRMALFSGGRGACKQASIAAQHMDLSWSAQDFEWRWKLTAIERVGCGV